MLQARVELRDSHCQAVVSVRIPPCDVCLVQGSAADREVHLYSALTLTVHGDIFKMLAYIECCRVLLVNYKVDRELASQVACVYHSSW